jgi:pimeloyl-ACP methyl ester carboxylesterase
MPNQVAVLIPGIMGSELRLNGKVVWPGPVASLLFPYKLMAELLDPATFATDVIRTYSITTQYQALIDDLGTLGFHEATKSLIVFPYDWRKANEESAAALAGALDAAAISDVEFVLLAHSMGGLIARYYLESGHFAGRPAFRKVSTLITLGTPHRGAPLALHRILGQEKSVWLSAAQSREAVTDPRYPSAYQLLPPPGEPFSWDEETSSRFATIDLYDEARAKSRGLSVEGLQSARNFHEALNLQKKPAGVRYFCYCGTRQTTATVSVISETAAGFTTHKHERDDGGDGVVPFWSSSLPGVQSFSVGGEHSVIYKDKELRRTLAALLGKPGALGRIALGPLDVRGVEVSVRDKVVEPGQPVHLVLTPVAPGQTLDGELRVEKAIDETTPQTAYLPAGPPMPIRYQGPAAASFGLVATAPTAGGAYRFAFYPVGAKVAAGSDTFLVQGLPKSP